MIKLLDKKLANKAPVKIFILGLCIASLVSCGDFDEPVNERNFSGGDIDTSNYVALGDSLTAGFADGALYQHGQVNSFPNILAGAFKRVGGGAFKQPLVDDNLGGLNFPGDTAPSLPNRLVLSSQTGALAPKREGGTAKTNVGNIVTGPFNNLGIPGARSFHLPAEGYGNIQGLATGKANPYFVRFASKPETSVVLDAASQQATFFTLWIGNNDILGYATQGGTGADSKTMPAYGVGAGDITDPVNVFTPTYNGIVAALTNKGSNNTKGALINIPALTSIPFFTTVPYNAIPLDEATANQVNTAYAAYNGGLEGAVMAGALSQVEADRRKIKFVAGQNAALMLDDSLTDLPALNPAFAGLLQLRQATDKDFILLTSRSVLGKPRDPDDATSIVGVAAPLTDAEVLSEAEAAEVEAARKAFNSVIKSVAGSSPNLTYVDIAAVLLDASDQDGLSFGTGRVTSTFATGGAFSLDGVHPTAKGYAVVTNAVIDQLNSAFSANVPRVDPGFYSEVFFED